MNIFNSDCNRCWDSTRPSSPSFPLPSPLFHHRHTGSILPHHSIWTNKILLWTSHGKWIKHSWQSVEGTCARSGFGSHSDRWSYSGECPLIYQRQIFLKLNDWTVHPLNSVCEVFCSASKVARLLGCGVVVSSNAAFAYDIWCWLMNQKRIF